VVTIQGLATKRKCLHHDLRIADIFSNHNLDPSVVGSPSFCQIFKTALPGNYNGVKEQLFAQPLVYTTADGIQFVFLTTTQNNVYKIDAKTGAIVQSRNLHIPFLSADLDGCVDINPHIGVTATGVIDPTTNTLYLTSKTYVNQAGGDAPQGRANGRYYVHAINVDNLSERAGFPVNLEGVVARNNPVSCCLSLYSLTPSKQYQILTIDHVDSRF
jgi:hypothetical protein